MTRIRLCRCGAPPLHGPWCWACAQDQQKHREPLGVVPWDIAEIADID